MLRTIFLLNYSYHSLNTASLYQPSLTCFAIICHVLLKERNILKHRILLVRHIWDSTVPMHSCLRTQMFFIDDTTSFRLCCIFPSGLQLFKNPSDLWDRHKCIYPLSWYRSQLCLHKSLKQYQWPGQVQVMLRKICNICWQSQRCIALALDSQKYVVNQYIYPLSVIFLLSIKW